VSLITGSIFLSRKWNAALRYRKTSFYQAEWLQDTRSDRDKYLEGGQGQSGAVTFMSSPFKKSSAPTNQSGTWYQGID
jgi:hypothetical protein